MLLLPVLDVVTIPSLISKVESDVKFRSRSVDRWVLVKRRLLVADYWPVVLTR
jgi:hypothetical protein